jgi:hypothetical protein
VDKRVIRDIVGDDGIGADVDVVPDPDSPVDLCSRRDIHIVPDVGGATAEAFSRDADGHVLREAAIFTDDGKVGDEYSAVVTDIKPRADTRPPLDEDSPFHLDTMLEVDIRRREKEFHREGLCQEPVSEPIDEDAVKTGFAVTLDDFRDASPPGDQIVYAVTILFDHMGI